MLSMPAPLPKSKMRSQVLAELSRYTDTDTVKPSVFLSLPNTTPGKVSKTSTYVVPLNTCGSVSSAHGMCGGLGALARQSRSSSHT